MHSSNPPSGRAWILALSFLFLVVVLSQTVSADAWQNIKDKMSTIVCGFKKIFATVATGVAAFTMVIAGIQWVSSEADPGARKKAKTTMIHAMLGLIIISIANDIVNLILKSPCP
ncbi:MAG: hypothetical protein FJY77_04670 [Candidatus Altiarchaeales archaeon]|nr:hypothetical protein [Candidatus Altiarchaeales archaeon]